MVPNQWDSKTLKELLSTQVKNGYSPNAVEQTTGYVVLGLGALTDHSLDTSQIKNVEVTEQVLRSQLCKGDFLISRSNTPDKVGRSVMFRAEVPNCSYPDLMMKFRPDESRVEPSYLEIYLQSSKARQYFKNCAAGSNSSMVKINKSAVEKTPILLPPLLEQRKIAKILTTWDKAIIATEKLIKSSKQQKKALMQQLLTGKKRLVNPETGQVFDGEWKEFSLGGLEDEKLITLNRGKVISKKDIESFKGDYPIYSSSVKNKGMMGTYGKYMFNEELISWSVDGGGHFFHRSKHKFSITNVSGYMRLETSELNYKFLAEQLSLLHTRFKFDYQTKAHPSVIRKLYSVTFPAIGEQQKIASVFTTADKEIEVLEAELTHFKQEKKALTQQLLTGKCRVKVDEMEVA